VVIRWTGDDPTGDNADLFSLSFRGWLVAESSSASNNPVSSFNVFISVPFASQLRALPAETKVESGTSQSKIGTCVDLSNRG